MTANPSTEPTQWIIHDERIIDDTRRAQWSKASVQLPDGVRFEQYVLAVVAGSMSRTLASYSAGMTAPFHVRQCADS